MNRANRRAQKFRDKAMQKPTLQQPAGGDQTAVLASLALKLYQMDKKLNEFLIRSRKADWRSLALLNLTGKKGIITREEVETEAEAIQQKEFDQEVEKDSNRLKLKDLSIDAVAAVGHHAVGYVSFYKNGKRLTGEGINCFVQVGKYELFPELDDAIVGMKVGESKRFPVSLQQATDEGEVVLKGLKEPISKEKNDEVAKA